MEKHGVAGNNTQSNYDDLLLLYGGAMIRVGELETKVAGLTNRDHAQEDVPAPMGQGTSASTSEELKALAGKIDTLGRRMTDSGERGPDPASQPSNEFIELRLQITSMANQLALAQDELLKLRESRKRRSHRTPPAPWWKDLGRRLGFRPPHSP